MRRQRFSLSPRPTPRLNGTDRRRLNRLNRRIRLAQLRFSQAVVVRIQQLREQGPLPSPSAKETAMLKATVNQLNQLPHRQPN